MAELLKDLFSKEFVVFLSSKIKKHYKEFNDKEFKKLIFDKNWKDLELKERMRKITLVLNDCLVFEYEKQLDILIKAKNEFSPTDSMGLQAMTFQDFVEVFGLDDYENSIKALEEFTIDSSSEFAIRQFILKYEDETMSQMKIWAKSENEHIRRLASEGCRPRLPWAIALPNYKKDPSRVLEVLELLKNDDSKYVQKSVANNLNDIAKDNAHLVIEFVKNNLGKSANLDWICKHASRTLLKKGNKDILELFGYVKVNHVRVDNFVVDEQISIGDDLNFSFDLTSDKDLGNLRVEYAIDYLKSNGTHSRRIYMLSQNKITKSYKSFTKKQSFKNMTTRKHYSGGHTISIVINGELIEKKCFLVN